MNDLPGALGWNFPPEGLCAWGQMGPQAGKSSEVPMIGTLGFIGPCCLRDVISTWPVVPQGTKPLEEEV